jgi:exodeoxyribonuclease VII large subunit
MQGRLTPLRDRILRAGERMERSVDRRVERRRQTLGAVAGKLDALSPLSVLGRGYAVALGEGGHVLRRTADFPVGTEFELRVSDGTVDCRATEEGERE